MYNNINSNLNEQENRIDWCGYPFSHIVAIFLWDPIQIIQYKNKHNVNMYMDTLDYTVLCPYLDTRSDLYQIDSSRNTSN